MTPDDFRRLVLEIPAASESNHMAHPDFRVGKRIFATLDYPQPGWAMVRLDPAQQELLMEANPGIFSMASGAWGRDGSTLINLANIDEDTARSAIQMAYDHLERRYAPR